MTKGEMIERLVEYSITEASQVGRIKWIREVFKKGFNGFSNMSHKQLEKELQLRGLLDYNDFESDDTDDSELMVMLSGMVGASPISAYE